MAKEPTSIRLPDETKKKLEKLSKATGRTKSYLAAEAIEAYCKTQSWQIEAIEQGVRAADNGELISHEELKQKWVNKRENKLD